MKLFKNALVLLMAAALLLSVMACEATTKEQPASEESASSPAEEATAPKEVENAPKDEASAPVEDTPEEEPPLEDEVLEEAGPINYELPLFDETQPISIWYPKREGRTNLPAKADGAFPFWNRLAENLNVEIDFTEVGQTVALEKYNLMIAAEEMTDLIFEGLCSQGPGAGCPYSGGYEKAVEDEIYIDLAPYVEEYAPNYYRWVNIDAETTASVYTENGYLPTFALFLSEPRATNMGLVVNADYLDATGLEMPETVSQWGQVFAAMKNNGVAYPCYVDSSASAFQGTIMAALGASLTTEFVVDNATGQLVFAPSTDESREYIEIMADWYSKGYINPDFMNSKSNDYTDFNNGLMATGITMGGELDTYQEKYGVRVYACPVVRGEELEAGQVKIGSIISQYLDTQTSFAVSTNCENIEAVMKFMDWFYSEEGSLICNYGWIEGETYDMVDGKPVPNDFFFESSEYTVAQKTLYTTGEDFGLVNPNVSLQSASETQLKACAGWTSDAEFTDYVYLSLPRGVSLTAEESEQVTNKWTDIDTLVTSQTLSWIVGRSELTDESWEKFISDIQDLGLEECRTVYQAALDRYYA